MSPAQLSSVHEWKEISFSVLPSVEVIFSRLSERPRLRYNGLPSLSLSLSKQGDIPTPPFPLSQVNQDRRQNQLWTQMLFSMAQTSSGNGIYEAI